MQEATNIIKSTPTPIGVFRSHFQREPDLLNTHDLACLKQIEVFRERHGRLPDTGARADLSLLQAIEIEGVSDACQRAADNEYLNSLEVEMMDHPAAEMPLTHRFTPGLYIRELLHRKGVLTATKIHKTEHPFVISKGAAMVSLGDGNWHKVEAPYCGITKPGTRRLIYAIEDMVITTFHPTTKTDLAEIEEDLIFKHDKHRAGLVQPTKRERALEGATL